MGHPDLAVVTGAFGFTGAYAVQGLVDQRVRMKTLSRRLADRNPLGGLVETISLDFPDPDGLSRSMAAVGVPCNTYLSLSEKPVGW